MAQDSADREMGGGGGKEPRERRDRATFAANQQKLVTDVLKKQASKKAQEAARRQQWLDAAKQIEDYGGEGDLRHQAAVLDVFKQNLAAMPEEYFSSAETERLKRVYLANAARYEMQRAATSMPGSAQYDLSKNSILNTKNLNNIQGKF